MSKSILSIFLLSVFLSYSQIAPTSSEKVETALQQKSVLSKNSIVKNTAFSNIGPTVMSGRVVDVDVKEGFGIQQITEQLLRQF